MYGNGAWKCSTNTLGGKKISNSERGLQITQTGPDQPRESIQHFNKNPQHYPSHSSFRPGCSRVRPEGRSNFFNSSDVSKRGRSDATGNTRELGGKEIQFLQTLQNQHGDRGPGRWKKLQRFYLLKKRTHKIRQEALRANAGDSGWTPSCWSARRNVLNLEIEEKTSSKAFGGGKKKANKTGRKKHSPPAHQTKKKNPPRAASVRKVEGGQNRAEKELTRTKWRSKRNGTSSNPRRPADAWVFQACTDISSPVKMGEARRTINASERPLVRAKGPTNGKIEKILAYQHQQDRGGDNKLAFAEKPTQMKTHQ